MALWGGARRKKGLRKRPQEHANKVARELLTWVEIIRHNIVRPAFSGNWGCYLYLPENTTQQILAKRSGPKLVVHRTKVLYALCARPGSMIKKLESMSFRI